MNEIMSRDSKKEVKRCRSCGLLMSNTKKRYHSQECKNQLTIYLDCISGLLRALNCQFAVFSWTKKHLFLEILPEYSETVFCYQYKRTNSFKPAQDLKHLMNDLGTLWWNKKKEHGSRASASESVLNVANFIKDKKSLSIYRGSGTIETAVISGRHLAMKYFKLLEITPRELLSSNGSTKLKNIYRRKVFDAHPDKGGNNAAFIRVKKAYDIVNEWLKNPKKGIKKRRKGLPNSWFWHDGKWSPPSRSPLTD